MARMHSRRKGKSGSRRPLDAKKPVWVTIPPKELELLIVKLAKEGKTASTIGTILRDRYGIPSVHQQLGKKVTALLREKKLTKELPEDVLNLIRRVIVIRKHLEANHKDTTALRGLQLTESKIQRLVKYYKETEVLPHTWKYDPKNIQMYAN